MEWWHLDSKSGRILPTPMKLPPFFRLTLSEFSPSHPSQPALGQRSQRTPLKLHLPVPCLETTTPAKPHPTSAGLPPVTSFPLLVQTQDILRRPCVAALHLVQSQPSFPTPSSHLVLLPVVQAHQPHSYLRALAFASPGIHMAFSLILLMSLLQVYCPSKAFDSHSLYSSPYDYQTPLPGIIFLEAPLTP